MAKAKQQMNPVGWFEIPVTDLKRAKKFYEGTFGLKLELHAMGECEMAMFPMHMGAPSATGALVKVDGYTPSHEGTVVYFSVPAINPTLAKIKRRGGKTLMPKTSIGEHGFFAQFEDSEGNRVAIHAMK